MGRNDLNAQRLRELLSYDQETGALTRRANTEKGRQEAGQTSGMADSFNGRRRMIVMGHNYDASRLAFLYEHGRWPVGGISHLDGNPLNNAAANLREISSVFCETSDLTAEKLRELLGYDNQTGVFTRNTTSGRWKAGAIVGYPSGSGYLQICVCGKQYLAHRLAWLYTHSSWPTDQIDHIDGDRSNNSLGNLRAASNKTNQQNLHGPRRHGKSGFLGVSFYKRYQRWKSAIRINGKDHGLGYFDTPEAAHEAYLAAKRELHPFCTI